MSATTAPTRKKNVVVVGGGITGSIFTHKLSAQLDPSKTTLTLIESRPYAIWLIAGCRLTVTDQGRLEDSCFVPCDDIFVNGNGRLKRGTAVALEVKTDDAEKDSDESDAVVLDSGERVPFDVLVLATGCKHSGHVAFPDATESIDHVKEWRNKFKDAKDICLVGGGGVAVGPSLLKCFFSFYI
jgi:NADH dehydrogenase FAD-containing subunit